MGLRGTCWVARWLVDAELVALGISQHTELDVLECCCGGVNAGQARY